MSLNWHLVPPKVAAQWQNFDFEDSMYAQIPPFKQWYSFPGGQPTEKQSQIKSTEG
jgi:hypothetical protein